MNYAYLDWNVFNKIEKKNSLEKDEKIIYDKIELLIKEKKIIVPYSNAHINDLIRGFQKTSEYIDSHLNTIERLTDNLCIVQYWGEKAVRWHYRSIKEFFYTALDENDIYSKTFLTLLDDHKYHPDYEKHQKKIASLAAQKMPKNFKKLYNMDPIFELLFPKTKAKMNLLAFCEDFFEFVKIINKDFSIYKSFRKFLAQSSNIDSVKETASGIKKAFAESPKHLTFDELWEKGQNKSQITENPEYNLVTDTFYKIDFKGIKSDSKFANLIDDSLHAFYGFHCDYFITIDDRCLFKARETYKTLNINSKALTPSEFVDFV